MPNIWNLGRVLWMMLLCLYSLVLCSLALSSVAGVWPFPRVLPDSLSAAAWLSVVTSAGSVGWTMVFGLASSLLALLWAVAWLELAPSRWDAQLRQMLYLPLLLPGVLWVVGLHRLALALNGAGHFWGVLLAHWLAVLPYTLIMLSPAYLGFDARYAQVSAALGKTRLAFLLQVKWPLLRQSLWAAFAVGFAVSVAQYLPTLYVGEGRFVTVTTEAVNLSAGGQRSLVAAFAGLQWLLPALVFAVATWAGRPRRFAQEGAA